MAHESRQKHLANAKSDAKINIGMGVVGTALAVVPLVVAAPVVLPIIGIALGVGSIAAVVRSVVHSVGSQRSENKIQGALREAVATKGVMTEEKINSVLEQIKSKNQTRDRARIVAFNGAAAAVSNMIDGLVDKNSISRHGSSLKHLAIKAEVVKLITSDKILKNGTDTHVKQLLNNLNHSNLEATKKEIMGFLAAAAI